MNFKYIYIYLLLEDRIIKLTNTLFLKSICQRMHPICEKLYWFVI